jgi:hypothetical protein
MLGWRISVYRQKDGGFAPATNDSERAELLATWQTGPDGLRWLDDLVTTGRTTSLSGGGYPNRFTARAEFLIEAIVSGPPKAYASWVLGLDAVALPGWPGKTVMDHAVIDDCRWGEWLLVVAWDES